MFRKSDLLQGTELRVEVLQSSDQLPFFAELVLLDAQGGVELLHQKLDIIQPLCLLMGQQIWRPNVQTNANEQTNTAVNTIRFLAKKKKRTISSSYLSLTVRKRLRANSTGCAFSLPVLTSPWWPHEVCGVVDDELEIIQQQDVYACGGGDPCPICRERQTGVEAVKRDGTADRCPLQTPLTSLDNQASCCVITLRG